MAAIPKLNSELNITSASARRTTAPTRETWNHSQAQREGKKRSRHGTRGASSVYDSRPPDAALRQAVEGGYLVTPSRTFLLKRCSTAEKETRSLKEIDYLHLSLMHIRTLGHIQSCRHLKVCILDNNYLTRFNALANCPELVRLDLHSNQISKLPDEMFWSQLTRLQILNLHDNGLGNLDSVQALAVCPSLIALTLYDTPVSLKQNYRHHTVNSIWTLRALDHHVISDEEIIEDARFSGRFRACHPSIAVDLCPKEKVPAQERTLDLELVIVRRILQNINRILARCSPVIVIQRWIRGYLARKKRGVNYVQIVEKLRKHSRMSGQPTPGEGYDIDFDMYMENRRPGSKTPPGERSRRAESLTQRAEATDSANVMLPTSLHINLAKLEKLAMKKLLQQSPDFTDIVQVTRGERKPVEFSDQKKDGGSPMRQRRPDQGKPKRKDPQTVQQMLGPKDSLVQPPSPAKTPYSGQRWTPNIDMGTRLEDLWVNGEQPQHIWRVHNKQFQLEGDNPPVMEADPIQDLVVMTQEAGHDVREAEEFWHEQRDNRPKPIPTRFKPEPKYKDQVSLATLIAVSKAYKDRNKTDQLAMKMDRVLRIQQEKLQTRHIVNAFKEERHNVAMTKRHEDRVKLTKAAQQHEMNRATYVEYAQYRKEKAIRYRQVRHKDLMFAADFSNQHTSVSSALIRHDQQSIVDDISAEKKELVKGIQHQLTEQADLVRRYMEHKQLMLQLSGGQEKAELGTRALQEANERLLVSKQRVAAMKARKTAMKILHQPSAYSTDHPEEIYRASAFSDALRLSSSMLGDTGVVFPPTPRRGGAPNVTPVGDHDRSFAFQFQRPKTTTVVELPPVNPSIHVASRPPTLTLST